jgi:hypothetical protein
MTVLRRLLVCRSGVLLALRLGLLLSRHEDREQKIEGERGRGKVAG